MEREFLELPPSDDPAAQAAAQAAAVAALTLAVAQAQEERRRAELEARKREGVKDAKQKVEPRADARGRGARGVGSPRVGRSFSGGP